MNSKQVIVRDGKCILYQGSRAGFEYLDERGIYKAEDGRRYIIMAVNELDGVTEYLVNTYWLQ